MSPVIESFHTFYSQFCKDNLTALGDIYSDEVVFEDPAHRLEGLASMTAYFEAMLANTQECGFTIDGVIEQGGDAFVRWDMKFSHPRLKSGQPISVPGVSYLQFDDFITYHRDYFDLGAMLYEQLPLLGAVIRRVRSGLPA